MENEFQFSFDDSLFDQEISKRDEPIQSYKVKKCTHLWYLEDVRTEEKFTIFKHQADYFYSTKQYSDAIAAYNKVLDILPDTNTAVRRDIFESLVHCYLATNNVPQATKFYENLVEKSTNCDHETQALSLHADILHVQCRYQEEKACLHRLISYTPNHNMYWLRLASCYLSQSNQHSEMDSTCDKCTRQKRLYQSDSCLVSPQQSDITTSQCDTPVQQSGVLLTSLHKSDSCTKSDSLSEAIEKLDCNKSTLSPPCYKISQPCTNKLHQSTIYNNKSQTVSMNTIKPQINNMQTGDKCFSHKTQTEAIRTHTSGASNSGDNCSLAFNCGVSDDNNVDQKLHEQICLSPHTEAIDTGVILQNSKDDKSLLYSTVSEATRTLHIQLSNDHKSSLSDTVTEPIHTHHILHDSKDHKSPLHNTVTESLCSDNQLKESPEIHPSLDTVTTSTHTAGESHQLYSLEYNVSESKHSALQDIHHAVQKTDQVLHGMMTEPKHQSLQDIHHAIQETDQLLQRTITEPKHQSLQDIHHTVQDTDQKLQRTITEPKHQSLQDRHYAVQETDQLLQRTITEPKHQSLQDRHHAVQETDQKLQRTITEPKHQSLQDRHHAVQETDQKLQGTVIEPKHQSLQDIHHAVHETDQVLHGTVTEPKHQSLQDRHHAVQKTDQLLQRTITEPKHQSLHDRHHAVQKTDQVLHGTVTEPKHQSLQEIHHAVQETDQLLQRTITEPKHQSLQDRHHTVQETDQLLQRTITEPKHQSLQDIHHAVQETDQLLQRTITEPKHQSLQDRHHAVQETDQKLHGTVTEPKHQSFRDRHHAVQETDQKLQGTVTEPKHQSLHDRLHTSRESELMCTDDRQSLCCGVSTEFDDPKFLHMMALTCLVKVRKILKYNFHNTCSFSRDSAQKRLDKIDVKIQGMGYSEDILESAARAVSRPEESTIQYQPHPWRAVNLRVKALDKPLEAAKS